MADRTTPRKISEADARTIAHMEADEQGNPCTGRRWANLYRTITGELIMVGEYDRKAAAEFYFQVDLSELCASLTYADKIEYLGDTLCPEYIGVVALAYDDETDAE